MASRRTDSKPRTRKPATTPEARESQLVSQAMDLVERQIEEGTASAQVLTHYIKLGSSRERLEQERLRRENELAEAKLEAMASEKRTEELYANALNAMRTYSGQEPQEEDEDYD